MKEDNNCMVFVDLLAFGVKNEPHHSLNYPGNVKRCKIFKKSYVQL